MSFVFPALLSTLVLAGIPVLLHLILRQKPKTLPFPAFRFLVARHQTNQRKMQVRHLLLLALRVALIAALIAAVARPRLLQQNFGLGLNSERPVAAVLILDVSASMDARSTDNRTRLDDAKKRALELLDELPPGSRVAVLASTDSQGEWITNLFQARQRIQNLKILPTSPAMPRSVIAGLKLLDDVATRREDEVATRLPRLLCVFSDTTQGAWSSALTPDVLAASDRVPVPREMLVEAQTDIAALADIETSPLKDLLTEFRETLPRVSPTDFPLSGRPLELVQHLRSALREQGKVASSDGEANKKQLAAIQRLLGHLTGYQTMWFDVGLDPPRDFAILDIEWATTPSGLPQESFRPGETVLLRPIVQALGQDFQATISAGDTKLIREVKAESRLVVPFEVGSATKTLEPGFHAVEFATDIRDVLAINNRRYATFVVRSPRKALVIADVANPSEDDFARALTIHGVAVDVRTPADVATGVPSGYDAVFLFAVRRPSGELWQSLAAFAKSGGGVAVIPGGDEMDADAYRTPAALAVLPGEFQNPVRLGPAGTRWDWQAKGVFLHPLFRPFENWLIDDRIDFVKFPPRVLAFWDTRSVAADNVLMRYRETEKRPALLERRLGTGRVLQFTTPLDLREPAWNTYLETIHSFYVVVTGLVTRHLTGELDPVQTNFVLGRETPFVPARSIAGHVGLSLRGPVSGPIASEDKADRVRIPQANIPGNYVISSAAKTTLAAFSVNLAPEAIDLTPWPAESIEQIFGAGARIAADRQAPLRNLIQGHWNEPVELFPYFMIALLVMLAIENWLANRFYRRDNGPTENSRPGEAA